MKATTDRNDNPIGDGSFSASYDVRNFSQFPQVSATVNKSSTTESVYVNYYNSENGNSITLRFSNHENNAVKFGDQLNGYTASDDEILYRLGLKKRIFTPETRLSIWFRQVSKKNIESFQVAELSIKEMYDLGADADLSMFKGKVAKDSNYLILGEKVDLINVTGRNYLGQEVIKGQFTYSDI